MGQSFRAVLGAALGIVAFASAAYAQTDPPGPVGRLAYTQGAVSFHDDQESGWSPAAINTPLTSGDSIWTEPNARSEISVAGSRVRMDGGTQLNMLAIDDSQTQLQVGQGRIDIKTFSFNPNTPYQVVTPRGTISLRQQGDYYVEAGSTEDATRLGVRSGAAQIESLNGQTAMVNPGQVAEISGDTGALQLRTLNNAPPPQPAYWAARDRQINYDVPQYLSAGVTGYEDLNAYGSWSNDSEYGNVWMPRTVPAGWQPYRYGHWAYVRPWGWTWVDDQPWGYAPSHYGRWANRNNRWVWVPPQREVQPVYAPALVAFIGGVEFAATLGARNNAPVGWFPLAPREAYVPSYSADRAYYTRLNSSNRIQEQVLEDRWQRAQRREAFVAGQNSVMANQRFATVVPASTFVRSQPVARAALRVSAAQVAAAPVAPVAAPPAPTASIAAVAAPTAATPAAKPADPKAATPAPAAGANANLPVAKTAIADMPTLAKPTTTAKPVAPGPKVATAPTTPTTSGNVQGKTAAPPLVPRTGTAPPVLKDDKAPAKPETTAKPAEPPKAVTPPPPPPAPQAKPVEPPKAVAPPPAPPVQQQVKPEPAKPVEPPKAAAPPQIQPAPPSRPAETRQPPATDTRTPDRGATVTPQHPAPAAEPPKPPPAPPQQRQVVPQQAPRPAPVAPPPAPKPPEQAEHKPAPPQPTAPAEKKGEEKK